jgi:hypothetical protein
MEVQDGFIVGIFNYCDRWCEACAFTSRCRLFADVARIEASLDPSLKAVADAPPLPQDVHEAPGWLEKFIVEANEATESANTLPDGPALPRQHHEIDDRARRYGLDVYRWLVANCPEYQSDPNDPLSVVSWFSTLIGSKIHRALEGLIEDDQDEREWPADYDGSAKIAFIGIERSIAAWRDLVTVGRVSSNTADSFLNELTWLREALDGMFPNARAFIRPGFDEPDAVAKLGPE